MINSYKDLLVWQKAMSLVQEVYMATKTFPKDEIFGIVSQIRRAAVSIPSNIAEGRGRNTKKEFVQFLYVAQGSLFELETQLLIAKNLSYLEEKAYSRLATMAGEVGKMLHGIINKLTAGT